LSMVLRDDALPSAHDGAAAGPRSDVLCRGGGEPPAGVTEVLGV
jgi:hypothetical protein